MPIRAMITSWGGEDFLSRLRSYASLLCFNHQSTLYLVGPSKADIEVHSTQLFSDDAVNEIHARSSYINFHSPVPAHRRPRPLSPNTITMTIAATKMYRSLMDLGSSEISQESPEQLTHGIKDAGSLWAYPPRPDGVCAYGNRPAFEDTNSSYSGTYIDSQGCQKAHENLSTPNFSQPTIRRRRE
ncbi:hypothetical protein V8E52_008089 [Russula decolorans]